MYRRGAMNIVHLFHILIRLGDLLLLCTNLLQEYYGCWIFHYCESLYQFHAKWRFLDLGLEDKGCQKNIYVTIHKIIHVI